MSKLHSHLILPITVLMILFGVLACENEDSSNQFRIASYNVSMYRDSSGHLQHVLHEAKDSQITYVAAVIQTVRPDILVLMEFDYDSTGNTLDLFQSNYLEKGQLGREAISYPYGYQIASNTGKPSLMDLNGDGNIALPDDAYGFGRFEGQYASAILSNHPLDIKGLRSFQKFNWANLPDALRPESENGASYYPDSIWNQLRLSSKNHIDIPVLLPRGDSVHILISHPTPPVFDGPEDRNGKRNHDEIRLWSDYLSNATYLLDDQGNQGGLTPGRHFVIAGDLNSDPFDGDSDRTAIRSLLNHPAVNAEAATGSMIPTSLGALESNRNPDQQGDPRHDTSFFGLRIDYLIPGKTLEVLNSGVFWPSSTESGHELIVNGRASDHLMVWMDLTVK